MDPVIFEFLGGLLVGAFVGLMVILRNKRPSPEIMPMLAVRTSRSASSARRRRTSPLAGKAQNTVTIARTRRKAKNKTQDSSAVSQTPEMTSAAAVSFDTCPSCGLQAPGSLLTEHFLGSPSHRNGLPKVVEADPVEVEAAAEANEEDSRQSVRNLLQMLVPPRAFGRRHAHKSVIPISPIVKSLGSGPGRTRRL